MKSLPLVLLLHFMISGLLFSQPETAKIIIEVKTSVLPDSCIVYVAGNVPELGSWKPDKVALEKIDSKLWRRVFKFQKGLTIEYKFTKGSWSAEALNEDATIPSNSILKIEKDTVVSVSIKNWRDNFDFEVAGQVTGRVEIHKNFVLDDLKPRDVLVWLPPNYAEESGRRFPVLFMHDAQNIFDPRTLNTFIDWQVDETADILIRNGEIEPIIIVGINNTDDRGLEYTNTPKGRTYMKLIVEKIKPFIDSVYRTLHSRNNTAVGGSSLGGLISFMMAWEYPDIFSMAACFSPAFHLNSLNYIPAVRNDPQPRKNIKVYIDNGGIGLEQRLQPGIDEMISLLLSLGYEKDLDLAWYFDPYAEHNEKAWAERVWRPLKFFFAK